jgi:hypothetical protein
VAECLGTSMFSVVWRSVIQVCRTV